MALAVSWTLTISAPGFPFGSVTTEDDNNRTNLVSGV